MTESYAPEIVDLVRSGETDATFSPCGLYRYTLLRSWEATLPRIAFIMLNPSTADERANDPTVRRCLGFARHWGFGSLEVGNLFALRATNPHLLTTSTDPIGPENDAALLAIARRASLIVVAWGAHQAARMRAREFFVLLPRRSLFCLGVTRAGAPRHPLYVAGSTALEGYPQPWQGDL